jgi:transcriptional pleiotropic regulator of transition state genes
VKSTGMTRPVDELGRVTLPKEIRKSLGIVEREDRLEIFVDGPNVILRKLVRGCVFCKGTKELKPFGDKEVCSNCRNEIRKGLQNLK